MLPPLYNFRRAFPPLFSLLKREGVFLRALPENLKLFLLSVVVYQFAAPLLGVFCTAYMLQTRNDVLAISCYFTAFHLFIPVGFLITGFILKRVSTSVVYAGGLITIGAATIAAAYFCQTSDVDAFSRLSCVGALSGSAAGVYWASRNVLSFTLTESVNRDLYFGLESCVTVLLAVIVPLVFGYAIQYSFFLPTIINREMSFWALLALVWCALLFGARQILAQRYSITPPNSVVLQFRQPPLWCWARLLLYSIGATDSYVSFVPVVLTFSYLGQESTLGVVQSLSGIIIAVVVYMVGRHAGRSFSRMHATAAASGITCVISIILAAFPSAYSAVIFIVGTSLAMALFWNSTTPNVLTAMERTNSDPGARFSYILDREIFLTLGRTTGQCVLISLILYAGASTAVIMTALLLTPLQIPLYLAAKRLDRSTIPG